MQYYSFYYSLYYRVLPTPLQFKQYIIICFRVMSELHRIEKPEIYSDVFHP